MSKLRPAPALCTLLLPCALMASQPARAGACCAGATSTVPTRLGECEKVLVALGISAETAVGRWDADGAVTSSSLADDALLTTLGGAWRWDRKGMVSVVLPVRVNHKATDNLDVWGGGQGDLSASLLWDPLTEFPHGGTQPALPVPILTAGVRLPTGTSWQQADGALLEDVTGLPRPGAQLGLSVERTVDRTPWSVGLGSELSGSQSAFTPTFNASASVGRYLGSRYSVSASARHVRSYAIADTVASTSRTALGLHVATSRPLRWRAWGGVEADLPLPWLGSNNLRTVTASLGYALIR